MPVRERKRVPDHRSDQLKGSFPQGPPDHPRNTVIGDTGGENSFWRQNHRSVCDPTIATLAHSYKVSEMYMGVPSAGCESGLLQIEAILFSKKEQKGCH